MATHHLLAGPNGRARSRASTPADDAAHAYDCAGSAYRRYADATEGGLFAFGGRYDHADRALWTRIDAALVRLRTQRRHAIRILDLGCGPGTWLLRAVHRARELGFTAIEGRGIDPSPEMIALAHGAARTLGDPAIGIEFAVADLEAALAEEDDASCDLVLCLYGVLNHLPVPAHASAAAAMARVARETVIATVRAAGSLPTIYVAGIEAAAHFRQDNARDRMEVDLIDGRHLTFNSHLFRAAELTALFADHCTIREVTGLDIFHSRFADHPDWNPPGIHDDATRHRLDRLEQLCADDEVLIDSAAHILLVAQPRHRSAGA
ncbi:class I SAM-dependent methyltransferase [Sphingomonas sp. DT-204]|uniref:class I SAM-dependent methyltransferase n=1 Tax=Sphingomonas sp. DT-204 TaxID=3396166 RepID=UPI003F1B6C61